jgi:two-component system sensor histidine kinase YesM
MINTFKKLKSFSSLQTKITLMVLGVFIPILIFLIANNIYSSNLVKNQALVLNLNTITLYMKELDNKFTNIEMQLSRFSSLDSDFQTLEASSDLDNIHFSSQNISNALSEFILTNKGTDAAFIYASESNTLIDEVNSNDSFIQRESIRDYLYSYLNSGNANIGDWFPVEISGKNYFFRILKDDTTFVGTWISMGTLLDTFMSLELIRLDYVVFADANYKAVSPIPEDFSSNFTSNSIDNNIYTSKNNSRYIFIECPSINGQFELLAFISEKEILGGLIVFRILFFVLFIVILLLIGLIMILQNITILRPVENLVSAMQNVQAGHWDMMISETHSSSEFQLLNKTYNSMIREIKKLKINVYEEKLMKQKAELNFYQLQIRPHFLINALNIIYNLAQVGKFELIQSMSMYLIRHFQYTIKSNSSLVQIDEEIYYTKNYIAIQELRFPNSLETLFDIDNSLLHYYTPPLSIQTFVENSIKYAMTIEEPIKLTVSVKTYQQNSDKIIITIKDSGPGFSKKILESLNQNKKISSKKGEHIGIHNVIQRLWLLFENDSELIFSNIETGGAKIEMIIPKTIDGDKKQDD